MNLSRLRFLPHFILGALVVTPVGAGSLVPDPLLGTLEGVELSVSPGTLGYEPIPDLGVDDLMAEVAERCTVSLRQARFEVREDADPDAYFLVTIHHAWHGSHRDQVALLVISELVVPASPAISAGESPPRRRDLAIWSEQRLELTPTSKAGPTILKAVGITLANFVEARLGLLLEPSS